ncbi:MAG: class II fructose-bisphosphate aldolase [Clostridiales bacterium]|nr:class II fructose-bisphosphate aldolase [Clostridiales bacterium]
MLVTLHEVLKDAQTKKYAVGLFNTVNLEMAKGVLAAAEEARSPVIIGTAEVLLPAASLQELAPMLRDMAQRASVPVVLHFDHGLTEAKVMEAIDLGFTSVMYDCSTMSEEENTKEVVRLVSYAHRRGVTVEGELGHVGTADGGDESVYTQPEEALAFAGSTGVDALAVAIGTAHGAYKNAPKLQLELLQKIAAAVSVPLVLHGGSGLSDQDFRSVIERGIAKVNIFTDINAAAARAAHDAYAVGKGMTDMMPCMVEAVKAEVLKKMRVFGSCGRV